MDCTHEHHLHADEGASLCHVCSQAWPCMGRFRQLETESAQLRAGYGVMQDALDALGAALVAHHHQWTPEQRRLYEQATAQAQRGQDDGLRR